MSSNASFPSCTLTVGSESQSSLVRCVARWENSNKVHSSVGWLRAKDLSSFNFDDPLWREIPYFKDAVNYYAKIKGYPGFQEMRESKAGKDGRFCEAPHSPFFLSTSYHRPICLPVCLVQLAETNTEYSMGHFLRRDHPLHLFLLQPSHRSRV